MFDQLTELLSVYSLRSTTHHGAYSSKSNIRNTQTSPNSVQPTPVQTNNVLNGTYLSNSKPQPLENETKSTVDNVLPNTEPNESKENGNLVQSSNLSGNLNSQNNFTPPFRSKLLGKISLIFIKSSV